MRRVPASVLLFAFLFVLAACGGAGASVGQASFSCVGGAARAICLQNCNLGCSTTGCQRTNIAQNEIIVLEFSEAIDPATVTPSSVRFRTASGDQPVGELFVNGNRVEFVPTLSISGGQTFFGFAAGETYTMTIPGGENEPSVVRSTSGKPFEKTLTCTLQSTLGIVDLNGVPPSATLVSPTVSQLSSAPRDIDIVIEFNELIDATPFLSGTSSPVDFSVRRTRASSGGGVECDPASQPVTLTGSLRLDFDPARNVSVLSFRPSAPLPGNVCVQVTVTSGVQDLSGRPAQNQAFQFLTEIVPQTAGQVVEEFDDDLLLDVDASAGSWGGGVAVFSPIGGDGRHGAFDTSLFTDEGMINGKRTFTVHTDSTIIPAANTTSGAATAVTDGRFFFTRMVVPADVRLRFAGNVPPVFTVAGRLDILGEIDLAGASVALATASPTGQPGGAGSIFAGAGGQGGDQCGGFGLPLGSRFSGDNGESARLVAGHAYAASAAGSGGRGSSLFPASGLNGDLIFPTPLPSGLSFSPSAAAGGGGGGHWQAGSQGRVISNNHDNPAAMGPPANGGSAVQLFPIPTGVRSSLHFLVGGSGGGGAGSHCCLSFRTASTQPTWFSGGGGGGGGGAIALRAGRSLLIAPSALVRVSGGSTPNSSGTVISGFASLGGGGSGGSVVLQSGSQVEVAGVIDARGGDGGLANRSSSPPNPPNGASVQLEGGDGSPGMVRLEAPGTPSPTLLASMLPPPVAANVGTLVERDVTVSCRSRFYATGLIFGPDFLRYEIHATVDGVPTVFSDDPAVSNQPAQVGAALQVLFQAASVDPVTGLPTETRPWRTSVRTAGNQIGIASDGLPSFRFVVVLDRAVAQEVVIDRIAVFYLTST